MSPRLQSIALTAKEQIWLCITGKMKFTPPPLDHREANRKRSPGGRTFGAKNTVEMGRVKEIASLVIAGNFGPANMVDIADQEKVNPDSLRAAVWRLRKQAQPKRRAVA